MKNFKKPEPTSKTTGLHILVFALLLTAIIPVIAATFSVTFNPLEFLSEIKAYFTPFFERNLIRLKLISLVFSGLFLWGIIHIIKKTGYLEIKREQFLDILGKPYVARRRSIKGWRQIQKRLQLPEQNQWKLAILEADHILNEILKMSGYLGAKLEDKLELITTAQLSNVEDVKKAHQIRHKIAGDPSFEITLEQAKEIIEVYKKSFIELNLIQE